MSESITEPDGGCASVNTHNFILVDIRDGLGKTLTAKEYGNYQLQPKGFDWLSSYPKGQWKKGQSEVEPQSNQTRELKTGATSLR